MKCLAAGKQVTDPKRTRKKRKKKTIANGRWSQPQAATRARGVRRAVKGRANQSGTNKKMLPKEREREREKATNRQEQKQHRTGSRVEKQLWPTASAESDGYAANDRIKRPKGNQTLNGLQVNSNGMAKAANVVQKDEQGLSLSLSFSLALRAFNQAGETRITIGCRCRTEARQRRVTKKRTKERDNRL
jgi:hypothetical protein